MWTRRPPADYAIGTAVLVGIILCVPSAALPALAAEDEPASRPSSFPATMTSAPATTSASTTSTSSAPAEEKDRYFAIVNGWVYTAAGTVLPNATILAKNGKILEIGSPVTLPPDCEVVDARGMRVYPGLVAASAGGLHAGSNPEDATDVFSLNMAIALAAGITTAIAGNDAAKLTFGSTDGLLLRRGLYVNLNYSARRPLERAELRADLEKVREHLRKLRQHEIEKSSNPSAKPPDDKWLTGKNQDYLKLLKGEAIAVAGANRTQEILDLAALAREFGFKLVLRGAFEGWTVPSQIADAVLGAVITPRTSVEPDDDLNRPTGSSIETANVLRRYGIFVAVVPPTSMITVGGLAGRDLLHLNMEAAFAVRGGMSNDEAIRTITIDAARVLGIDDRVGSLAAGKDADMVVCDGDLLHYMTQVHYTVVNGRVAYDKTKDTLFAHIRPQGSVAVPKFDDVWPRRLEWPEAAEAKDGNRKPEN